MLQEKNNWELAGKWSSLIERSLSDCKKANVLRNSSPKIKNSLNFYLTVMMTVIISKIARKF